MFSVKFHYNKLILFFKRVNVKASFEVDDAHEQLISGSRDQCEVRLEVCLFRKKYSANSDKLGLR